MGEEEPRKSSLKNTFRKILIFLRNIFMKCNSFSRKGENDDADNINPLNKPLLDLRLC